MSRFNSGRFDSGGSSSTDLSGVTAGAGDVLAGKIIVNAFGAEVEGTMSDNADADVEIEDLAGTTIPAGSYDGTGKAILSAAEAAKVIPGNIPVGLTLLGVEGALVAANGAPEMDQYTKVLLHFDGDDNGTTFTDESGKTWTPEGTAVTSTVQKVFGSASGLFDGNSDYITTPDHADFNFGSDPFTIAFRIRPVSRPADAVIISQFYDAQNGFMIYYESGSASISFIMWNEYATPRARYEAEYSIQSNDAWYYVEVVRDGSNVYIFVNGVSWPLTPYNAIGANSMPDVAADVCVGAKVISATPSAFWNGYIDELVVSKGIARHTASYIP